MTKDKLRRNNMKVICGLKQCLPIKCQVKGVTYLVDSVFYPRQKGGIMTSERFQKAMIDNISSIADLTSVPENNTMADVNANSDCKE